MNSPAASTTPKKDLRYHSLDFWRGVACLMVAVIHSIAYVTENPAHVSSGIVSKTIIRVLEQGFAGVPMFFVISGYCIAAACESAMNKGMPTKTYFFRRFRRIYPPYWIVLLGVVALHFGFLFIRGADYLADNVLPLTKPWDITAWQWAGSITLTEGWRDHFIGEKSRIFLTPAWSLCYEEQFYFVCGMAMLFGRKWFYRLMAGLSAAVVAIVVISCTVVYVPVDGFFFDGHWLMFAAGVLVFYVVQFGSKRSQQWALWLMGIGFCIAVAWAFRQHLSLARRMSWSFLFGCIALVLFKYDRRIADSRILRPITWCGVMCYSLYLTHYPIEKITSEWFYRAGIQGDWPTLFITVPVSILVAVAFAWGFHLLVERRFLNTPIAAARRPEPVRQETAVPASVAD